MTLQQRYVGVNVTNAVVPTCCPKVCETVVVVLFMIVVLVDDATAFAQVYEVETSASPPTPRKLNPAVMPTLTPTELVMVCSCQEVKEVDVVTPPDTMNEHAVLEQVWGSATITCRPACGMGCETTLTLQAPASKLSLAIKLLYSDALPVGDLLLRLVDASFEDELCNSAVGSGFSFGSRQLRYLSYDCR